MHCIIMAGGSGTRFWPFSRGNKPKQMLNIVGNQTMLQMTIDRLKKCNKTEDVYIVTRKDISSSIEKITSGVKPRNIFVEPLGKNTAPCIGLSALHISEMDGEAVMGIFPADHLIVGHRAFQKALNHAEKIAVNKNVLVTIGIQPTFPSTAFGYIQYDPDRKIDKTDVYPVRTFAEKPHLNAAKRFLKSKDFLWNAGIFIWKVDVFLDQLGNHMPDLSEYLDKIQQRMKSNKQFDDIWSDIHPESIDYGLMEKARDIYVVKGDFRWSDLGSWNAVYDESPKGRDNNVIRGDGVVVDGKGNFIQNGNHFIAIVGLDNVVVVSTKDATLVVNKENVEDVRKVVEYLKTKDKEELL